MYSLTTHSTIHYILYIIAYRNATGDAESKIGGAKQVGSGTPVRYGQHEGNRRPGSATFGTGQHDMGEAY
jgi:hypothetical protein